MDKDDHRMRCAAGGWQIEIECQGPETGQLGEGDVAQAGDATGIGERGGWKIARRGIVLLCKCRRRESGGDGEQHGDYPEKSNGHDGLLPTSYWPASSMYCGRLGRRLPDVAG